MLKPKQITFVSHRLDKKGGQERSSLEVLSRLKEMGHTVNIVSYNLEDWSIDPEHEYWHKVPFGGIPIQLLKNIWFSLYTYFYLKIKRPQFVMTIGVSSWIADLRLVQFVHKRYLDTYREGRAKLPNQRTLIHRIYQLVFIYWTVYLEKVFFNKTKYFIAISQTVKDQIEELLKDKNRSSIEIIHHAPDRTDFHNKYIPEDGILELLFVGALERKGIKKVLDALESIKDESWVMNVVGDGDINRWKSYSKKLDIDKKVFFHGPRPAIPFFENAHIFVFPSTYEPFGLVVTEAISYGALPLASCECGAMELWNDRPEFLKISATDSAKKWAKTLEIFINDRKLLNSLISEAREAILGRSWDDAAKEYEACFLRIDEKSQKEMYI